MVHDFSLVFDTENPLWNNVLEIFKRNESYPTKCVKGRSLHHKFPRAISKFLNESEDNDKDNLVSLSHQDHFMIHYYYYKLGLGECKKRMALAFRYMANFYQNEIEEITPEIAEIISNEYSIARLLGNQRISEARKENGFSPEHRQHILEAKRNNVLTEEQRHNLGNGRRGKHFEFTEEHCKNISKGKMGHSTSEETKKKIGEANSQKLKGRKITEEHRNNISKAKTGVKREPMKEGQKETLSKLWKGKHWRIVNGKREWY